MTSMSLARQKVWVSRTKASCRDISSATLVCLRPGLGDGKPSKVHPHLFYRDVDQANEFGEQILAKIMLAFWTAPD